MNSLLSTDPRWYCIKCQPKREKAAASQLRTLPDVNVLFPQARYEKRTAKAKRTVMEALFPGYFFAHFAASESLKAVQYTAGVAYVVKRGDYPIEIAEAVVQEVRAITQEGILDLVEQPFMPGEKVRIISGIFAGSHAEFVELVPGKQRALVLLELLGQTNLVEIHHDELESRPLNPLRT